MIGAWIARDTSGAKAVVLFLHKPVLYHSGFWDYPAHAIYRNEPVTIPKRHGLFGMKPGECKRAKIVVED